MADFCKACSIEHFGKDFGDLKGFRSPKMISEGTYPLVTCEGCGHILVNEDDRCVANDCLQKGRIGHGEGK